MVVSMMVVFYSFILLLMYVLVLVFFLTSMYFVFSFTCQNWFILKSTCIALIKFIKKCSILYKLRFTMEYSSIGSYSFLQI